jgi:ProP effector
MSETNPQKARNATLDSFVTSFPAFRDVLPLAIGIHKSILERLPELTKQQVNMALKIHTLSTRYLKAMAKATQRFDLDGNAVGDVTDEQREVANTMVKERLKKAADRRKAEIEKLKAEAHVKQHKAKLENLVAKFNNR